ncbi:MAG: glutathione peroxidase [Thermomicrobiales bacterium]
MALADIPFQTMDGTTATLGDYAGDVVLVVNVASKCGNTPQYAGLEKLYEEKADDGLMILGFPANNFMGQEPGTDAEIAQFCTLNYGVTFPVLSKISVLGDDQHPLYAALTEAMPADSTPGAPGQENADVRWNFEKFLIAKDGSVVGRFAPKVTPEDPALTTAIDAELAK